MKSIRVAQTGILCALAIAIAAVEQLFPALPMLPPGAKPGFSNLVTMLAASAVSPGTAFLVALGKALFVGMTRGGMACVMSLAGGIVSTAVTVVLLKVDCFGGVGLGVAGACAHNLAQLAAASVMLSAAMVYYLPWMLFFAVITGALTGILFGLLKLRIGKILLKSKRFANTGNFS